MGLLVCTHAVEQSCPHSVPHVVRVTATHCDHIAIVLLQPHRLILRQTTTAKPSKFLLLRQFEKSCAHAFVWLTHSSRTMGMSGPYGSISTKAWYAFESPSLSIHVYMSPLLLTDRSHRRFAASTSMAFDLPW